MAIVPMQKINLFLHKADKSSVLDFLQQKGLLHVMNTQIDHEALNPVPLEDRHELELSVAELDFAIHFLSAYEDKAKGLQAMIDGDSVKIDSEAMEKIMTTFVFKDVVKRCQSVEEELNTLDHELKSIAALKDALSPWKALNYPLNKPRSTEHVTSFFLSVPKKEWPGLKKDVLSIDGWVDIAFEASDAAMNYAHVVVEHQASDLLHAAVSDYKVEWIDLPVAEGLASVELERLDERLKKIEERKTQLHKAAKGLVADLSKLRIAYDYLNWSLQKKQAHQHFSSTDSTVLIVGWMPKQQVASARTELQKITAYFDLVEVDKEEGEVPPVLIRNRSAIEPFRAVTDIYGLPLYHEVDPTPFHALFFIVFFGMCLTDAGYGILMFVTMWAALKYLDIPKSMRNMVRLLMYGGVFTFIMGVLFGGWFGLTPEQAPQWLTTVTESGDVKFIGQTFDALNNAMQVLIISLVLGYIQVLLGVWIKFVHTFRRLSKKEALLDTLPWAYTITVLGFLLMIVSGVLPTVLQQPTTYLLYAGLISIVLTQGRTKSNIIAKFLSGVLSLYDFVGYMSDVLSYSRLLALGLATAIIGMAVNIIAGLVSGVPYVGIVFVILILMVGHIFNIGINALGSFIHSGRLQFVEFFGKFMEGGGRPFRPFVRASRFVRTPK